MLVLLSVGEIVFFMCVCLSPTVRSCVSILVACVSVSCLCSLFAGGPSPFWVACVSVSGLCSSFAGGPPLFVCCCCFVCLFFVCVYVIVVSFSVNVFPPLFCDMCSLLPLVC